MIASETPKANLTVQGLEFSAFTPYAAGHVLTLAEASVLNQTRLENVRNNFAGTIRSLLAKHRKDNGLAEDAEVSTDVLSAEELRAKFEEMDAAYEFGVRRVGSGTSYTPLEKEARKIAEEKIKASLTAQNYKMKDLPEGWMAGKIDEISKNDAVVKEAQRRISAVGKIALEEIGVPAAAAAQA